MVAPPPYDVIEPPLCQAEGKGGTVAPPHDGSLVNIDVTELKIAKYREGVQY